MKNQFNVLLILSLFHIGIHSGWCQQKPNQLMNQLGPIPNTRAYTETDYWVWGGSVIKTEDGLYHMFVSRIPKHLPFHPGWMVGSEIAHVVSKTAEGPFEFQDVALPARGAQYWDGQSTHNPKITKSGDTYVLFYMGSTHPFEDLKPGDALDLQSPYAIIGRSNKRIGVAYAKNINGPWERFDFPILDTKPNTFYSFLTSNPAPWINEDGSVVILFKSRKYLDSFPYHSGMSIGVAKAENFKGPYNVINHTPIFSLEQETEVEDICLWKDRNGYHLLAKDQKGKITGYRGDGVLAHSDDAINWELDEFPHAYSKKIKNETGQIVAQGQLERCSVLLNENGDLQYLYFATMDGPGGFNNATESWSIAIKVNN